MSYWWYETFICQKKKIEGKKKEGTRERKRHDTSFNYSFIFIFYFYKASFLFLLSAEKKSREKWEKQWENNNKKKSKWKRWTLKQRCNSFEINVAALYWNETNFGYFFCLVFCQILLNKLCLAYSLHHRPLQTQFTLTKKAWGCVSNWLPKSLRNYTYIDVYNFYVILCLIQKMLFVV